MKSLTRLDVAEAWPDRLTALFERAPLVSDLVVDPVPARTAGGYDGDARFSVAGEPHRLIIDCTSSGQPRYVRDAMARLGVRRLEAALMWFACAGRFLKHRGAF